MVVAAKPSRAGRARDISARPSCPRPSSASAPPRKKVAFATWKAHPVLGGDHKEFFGSLQGCPAVPKMYMIQSLPQQGHGKGSRVTEPPPGGQKLAAFSLCSRGIAQQQQCCAKGGGCELCVLSLAEVAERSGTQDCNSEL